MATQNKSRGFALWDNQILTRVKKHGFHTTFKLLTKGKFRFKVLYKIHPFDFM